MKPEKSELGKPPRRVIYAALVLCPSCDHENPAESRFCLECGSELAPPCARCGAELPAGAKFCNRCGATTRPQAGSSEPASRTLHPHHGEGERRQLSVMFCDLVGSTELSDRIDAEDFREVVQTYQESTVAIVERYDGHVAQFLGDGLLAYFGWPSAHEDDAVRAVRAGLEIVDAALRGTGPAVRIGIHTGPVVVGEMGAGANREMLAMGDTTNVAARLEGLAEPNTVVFSGSTLRLVAGVFITRDLGAQKLRGLREPVRVHQALQPSGVLSRLDVMPVAGLTPFVGRDQELMLLEDRYGQVVEGTGHAVMISGEPGIGKSRLVQAFRERLAERTHTWLECRGSPYAQESAFFPLLELQRQGLGLEPEDSVEAKLSRIEAGLAAAGFEVRETAPLVASFHGLPVGDRLPPPQLSPEQQRHQTLELLTEWLLRLGQRQPVVLLLEDLHWMDPSTLEFVAGLLEQAPTAPVLILATYRRDFEPPWGARSFVTPLVLSRFSRAQVADLVRKTARGRELPQPWVDEILRRADGVPLFAEELTKAVLEAHPEPLNAGESASLLEIPETLQDLLMARLDALGPVKELAQIGSVLGREFSYELLLEVSTMAEWELQDALQRAVHEELFYQRGTPPESTYQFKHALVQDAAYGSLLRRRRSELHAAAAAALEHAFPELAASQPERLAHHLTEAGQTRAALEKWHDAGRVALQRSAHREASGHLNRALNLLAAEAPSPKRDRRELDLQLELGAATMMTHGWGSQESAHCYSRARELCAAVGDERELFPVLWGFWLIHLVRGQTVEWRAIASELRSMAERHRDRAMLLQAHHASWGNPFLGDLAVQLEHVERGLSHYDPIEHSSLAQQYGGHDAAVCGYGHQGVVLWAMGYPERSSESFSKAIALANEIGHVPSQAHGRALSAWQAAFRSDWPEAVRIAAEAAELVRDLGEPTLLKMAQVCQGWAMVGMGNRTEGLALMRRTLESGAPVFATLHAFYADALRLAGETEEALSAVHDALPMMELAGEAYWRANALTLRADLLSAKHLGDEAAASYRAALDLAQRQGARMWELRAATGLARLWQTDCSVSDARALLAPRFASFSEGFDTWDLKQARALLDSLGEEPG